MWANVGHPCVVSTTSVRNPTDLGARRHAWPRLLRFSENVGKEWRRRTSLARHSHGCAKCKSVVCTPSLAVSGCEHHSTQKHVRRVVTVALGEKKPLCLEKFSFFPRTIKEWNELEPSVAEAKSISQFKAELGRASLH
ncbi:hypothetical protein Bbelb_302910 [Branchiostoma belcheri]|nr:hypothetical protein Bbelb_302910 [Branchiostoma belcheri]